MWKSTSKLLAAPALPIFFLYRQAPALKLFMGVAMSQFFFNLFFGKAKDNHQDLTTSTTNDDQDNYLLLSDNDNDVVDNDNDDKLR